MKRISKKNKIIILITIALIIVIIGILIGTNAIKINILIGKFNSANNNQSNGNLLPEYIKAGITLGGVTGTLENLDTSDATATAEDIALGKTAYVDGKKITGIRANTIEEAKKAQIKFEEDKTLLDDYNNKVKVPEGFKVAEDSATAVEDGIVIEDESGNQFVWIPVGTNIKTSLGSKTINYSRVSYCGENLNSSYTESISSVENNSVNTNGGYYIGRFEAGDSTSTKMQTMRNQGSSQANDVSIKKNQVPYNYITLSNAILRAEEMATKNQYTSAITKLTSSYAWDTAISFIKIKNNDYDINSPEGNYNNTTFKYLDINKEEKKKELNTNVIVITGQTTAVSNIFDMGGNLIEFSTEEYHGGVAPHVSRGGAFDSVYNANPSNSAGRRYSDGTGVASFGSAFRIALFLN